MKSIQRQKNVYSDVFISTWVWSYNRSLAIIDHIKKNANYNIYIACDKNQNDFERTYLNNYGSRVIYKYIVTEIGIVNKSNSLEVYTKLLEEKLIDFISFWNQTVTNEYNMLKSLNLKCIISYSNLQGVYQVIRQMWRIY